MADPAREEADRFFAPRDHATSHPEDRFNSENESSEDEKNNIDSEPAFERNSRFDDTDEEDLSHDISTLTTSKTTYQLPTNVSYANTGPKGVIADARSFARAKRSASRKTLRTTTNNLGYNFSVSGDSDTQEKPVARTKPYSDKDSDQESEEDEMMRRWQDLRLVELSESEQYLQTQQARQTLSQRLTSPSRRAYGTVAHVNAEGYLDAIDQSPAHTTVVVLLYDPELLASKEVEDELDQMAYKWSHIRFVKLHYEVAEMEYLQAPSVLGYREAEVFGTISGARREGLEGVMRSQGFFR